MTDAQALQELAALVGAGQPIPPGLQDAANAAVARAVAVWTMPTRGKGGRPPSPQPARRAALIVAALREAGVPARESKRLAAETVHISESHAEQSAAAGIGEAQHLLALAPVHPDGSVERICDLAYPDDVIADVMFARLLVLRIEALAWDDAPESLPFDPDVFDDVGRAPR